MESWCDGEFHFWRVRGFLERTYVNDAKLWELLEGKDLFAPTVEGTDEYDEHVHLAQMTTFMGHVPSCLLRRGRRTAMFYHPNGLFQVHSPIMDRGLTKHTPLGQPKRTDLVPKHLSFEETVSTLTGQEKAMFLKFVRRMVKWEPEDRSSARELLNDPWLQVVAKP